MKITQTNDSELVIQNSGASGLVMGVVLSLIGVAVALYPFFATAKWWVSLIGIVMIGMGAAMIFTASNTRTVLRRTGTSSITEKRIVGGATKEATFESTQVAHVKLESHTEYDRNTSSGSNGRSGEQQRQRVSNLFIVLKDATEITVGTKRASSNGGFSINGIGLSSVSKAPLSGEAKQIADFFEVPLKTGVNDASLQDIVGAVQTAFTKPAAQTGTVPTAAQPVLTPVNTTLTGAPDSQPPTPASPSDMTIPQK